MYNQSYDSSHVRELDGAIAKTFMSNVFSWMGIALAITAATAYLFGTDMEMMRLLLSETGGMSALGWVVTLAPLGLVLLMGMGFQRMNYTTLVVVFGIYSVLMGMSLSFLILIYTSASIFKTFLITSLMFGFMAFLGYTTKTDLTKMGSILMMALFGLIIASLVNFFMKSAAFDYFISFIGVIIFTGLTAYDVQKLKRIGSGVEYQGAEMAKLTILGALTLYLDFINLFLFLLRLFGDRK